MKKIWIGKVHQCKFYPDDDSGYMLHLAKLQGKDVDCTIAVHRKSRSLNQNRYYWKVIIEICRDHFGYTPEEMHEALKWQFLRKHSDGKPDTCRSTTDLTTIEFEQYCSDVRVWASFNYNVYVPEPNEIEY